MANEFKVASKLVVTSQQPILLPKRAADPVSGMVAGDFYYNTTDNAVRYYNGTSWDAVATGVVSLTGQTLNNQNIIVGNSSNISSAVDTNATGDILANSVNGLTIKGGAVVDSHIATAANINRAKLAQGTANRLTYNDANGFLADLPAITADRALVSDSNGLPVASGTTATELGYVSGVTSSIQTQLDDKANKTLSNLTAPTALNVDLLPDIADSRLVGSFTKPMSAVWSNILQVKGASEADSAGNISSYINGLQISASGTNKNIQLQPTGTGVVDVSSKRIVNLADPTAAQDAATKNYVDTQVASIPPVDLSPFIRKDGTVSMQANLNLGQLTAGLFSSLTFTYSDGLSDYYTLVMSAPAVANYEIVKVPGNDAEYDAAISVTVGYLNAGTTSTEVAQEPAHPDHTFYAIRTSDYAVFKLATTSIGSASLYPYPPNFGGSNTYHKIINLGDPTLARDAANKQYVDAQIASIPSVDLSPYFKKDGSVELTGDIVPDFAGTRAVGTYNKPMGVMWTSQIYFGPGNLTRGTVDATDTEIILKSLMPNGNVKLQPDGTGFIDASSAKMSNLLDPTAAQDAATRNYVDTQVANYLPLSGGTMTGSINMGGNRITSLGTPVSALDAVTKAYADSLASGLDFQKDIDDIQFDNTLAPNNTLGVRYILTNVLDLNAGFSVDPAAEDNDIVEYNGSQFVVAYDVSVQGEGALVWNRAANYFMYYDGSSWSEFGGLTGVTAGVGLVKSGNTISVNLGAGIKELPSDEVGIDLFAASALMLTVDGTTETTDAAAQLSVKLDGSTLSKSVSGLKVAAGGITDNEINATANIAVSKLASLTANRVVQTDANGKLEASNVTSEDLVYLSGVTAPIQNQLNGKANVSLNNLSNTAVSTDLLTNGSLLHDLGSTTQGWKHVYANSYRNGAQSLQISNVFASAPTDTLSASFDATFLIGAFIYHANIPQGYARIISGDSGGNFTIDKIINTSINFEMADIVLPAALESVDVSSSISSAPAVLKSGNNTGSGATGDIILKTGIPNTASKRGNARVSASNVVIEVDKSTYIQSSDPNMYNSVRTDVKEYQLTANTSAFTPISLDLDLTQSICKSGEISYEVENLTTGEVRAGTIKFASSVSNIGFSDTFVSSAAAMDTNIEFQMVVNSGTISIEYKNLFTNICDFKIFRNTMGGFKI